MMYWKTLPLFLAKGATPPDQKVRSRKGGALLLWTWARVPVSRVQHWRWAGAGEREAPGRTAPQCARGGGGRRPLRPSAERLQHRYRSAPIALRLSFHPLLTLTGDSATVRGHARAGCDSGKCVVVRFCFGVVLGKFCGFC